MKDCFQESTGSIQQWQFISMKLTEQMIISHQTIQLTSNEKKHSVARYAYMPTLNLFLLL